MVMTGIAYTLMRFRSLLESGEFRRWYCYAGPYAETLLVKEKRSGIRYLFKVWETELPVGAARIREAIARYSRYKRQDVDRFAFLSHRFRVNAFDLFRSSSYLDQLRSAGHHFALALFGFESRSKRVVYECPEQDPLFRVFKSFLRREGFALQSRIPPTVKGKETVKVYLDSDVLIEYLRGGKSARALFQLWRKAPVQLVTSNLALQNVLLVSKKSRRPTPRQIRKLLEGGAVTVVESPLADEVTQMLRATAPYLKGLHPSDILSLFTADRMGCRYFVSLDKELLSKRRFLDFMIRSPSEVLRTVR